MRGARRVALLLALAVAVIGCGGTHTDHTDAGSVDHGEPVPEKVQLAATVAAEVEADPDRAAEILERHGLTEESYEQLMYEIAADPELSRAFRAARGN